jgi:hypothetical protein
MLRLFGLFVCVSLAFVFPQYTYVETLETLIQDIISTVASCVIVIAIFSRYVTTEIDLQKNT